MVYEIKSEVIEDYSKLEKKFKIIENNDIHWVELTDLDDFEDFVTYMQERKYKVTTASQDGKVYFIVEKGKYFSLDKFRQTFVNDSFFSWAKACDGLLVVNEGIFIPGFSRMLYSSQDWEE